MLSLLAASVLAVQQPSFREISLSEPGGKPSRLSIYVMESPLEPPKFSPKLFGDPPQRWQFDWVASSFGPEPDAVKDPQTGEPQGTVRFRVFSQVKKSGYDYTVLVARQAIRMWDKLFNRYQIKHNQAINRGIVDFYLCFGGEAGGEYTRGEDILPNNRAITVSTIYIYDIRSFSKPVEMAREIAHEYGHAVIPAVGGYTAPEHWANGFLGEKLLMRILRDGYEKKLIGPEDVMGSAFADLDAWVKKNVDPLVVKAATSAPNLTQLADKGPAGMDAYIGLVTYADTIFPPNVVTRSMLLMGSQSASDYPESLLRATQEMPKITLAIPSYLKGKAIWIPLGKGKVAQAQILKRSGSWAQIMPQAGGVVITTSRESSN
jgi:hypothetical protein